LATSTESVTGAATRVAHTLAQSVEHVLEGKREVVELAVTCLLAGGHLLVEDVPGVGKTTLARGLAASLGVSFRRLQFTSDLMPSDVVGGNVYEPKSGLFSFRAGPVFTHVLLADEINRTTPKTQSALLEAMDEGRVSVEGETHDLPDPFFVVATQNPEDFYGTYPLPESQLDRFLLRIHIGYPPADVERRILRERRGRDPVDEVNACVSADDLRAARRAVDEVRVEDVLLDYVHALVLATRSTPSLSLGASTRAALALERAVRAHALVAGRDFAIPDDVKHLAGPVLAHRVQVNSPDPRVATEEAERVIRALLEEVEVPI